MSFNTSQQGAFWDFVRSISDNVNNQSIQATRGSDLNHGSNNQPWGRFHDEDFARFFQQPPPPLTGTPGPPPGPPGPPPPSHPPHVGRHGRRGYRGPPGWHDAYNPESRFDFGPGGGWYQPDEGFEHFSSDEEFDNRHRHHGRHGGRGRGGYRSSDRHRDDCRDSEKRTSGDEGNIENAANETAERKQGEDIGEDPGTNRRREPHGEFPYGSRPGRRGHHGPHGRHGGSRSQHRHSHGRGRGGFPPGRGGFGGARHEGRHDAFDMSNLVRAISSHPIAQFLTPFMPPSSQSTFAQAEEASDSGETFIPLVDIFNTSSAYVLHVSLPGAKKEDVGVNWDAVKGELNIAGVIHRQGDENFIQSLTQAERKVGLFDRSVKLPPVDALGQREENEIDGDDIVAKLEDGVLTITVRKLEREWTDVKKVSVD